MAFTHFQEGNYAIHSLNDAVVQARAYFESLPGGLRMRTINLCFCDSTKIVRLKERAEYTPTIQLFQYKESADRKYVYGEEINVTQEFLSELEQFLREHAIDVPVSREEDVPLTFRSYYKIPFTLVPIVCREYDVTKTEPRGRLQLMQHVRTAQGPAQIDDERGLTLRMVPSEVMEEKLHSIEEVASYTALVKEQGEEKVSEARLLFMEYRNGWDHVVFKII